MIPAGAAWDMVPRQGEAIFDELREQWQRQIGPAQLDTLEAHLAALVGETPVRFGAADTVGRERAGAGPD